MILADGNDGFFSRGKDRARFLEHRPSFPPKCLNPPNLPLSPVSKIVHAVHLQLLALLTSRLVRSKQKHRFSLSANRRPWSSVTKLSNHFCIHMIWQIQITLGDFLQLGQCLHMSPKATPPTNPQNIFQAAGARQLAEKVAARSHSLVCFNVNVNLKIISW